MSMLLGTALTMPCHKQIKELEKRGFSPCPPNAYPSQHQVPANYSSRGGDISVISPNEQFNSMTEHTESFKVFFFFFCHDSHMGKKKLSSWKKIPIFPKFSDIEQIFWYFIFNLSRQPNRWSCRIIDAASKRRRLNMITFNTFKMSIWAMQRPILIYPKAKALFGWAYKPSQTWPYGCHWQILNPKTSLKKYGNMWCDMSKKNISKMS